MGNCHLYYHLTFRLLSPMLIGSGRSDNTDNDVLLDSAGRPYIPATSIAGVLRHFMRDAAAASGLFGSLDAGGTTSKLIIYDAVLAPGAHFVISDRDNVALDPYKVAKKGAKFDYEVVEPDAVFVGLIELLKDTSEEEVKQVEAMLLRFANDMPAFGAKTRRGLGRVELTIRKKAFSFDAQEQIEAWLHFDPFNKDSYPADALLIADGNAQDLPEVSKDLTICLGLRLRDALSIRVYGTTVEGVDFEPLYSAGQAVVPGTSWAGAFRRRVLTLCGDDEQLIEQMFGYVKKSGENETVCMPSRIAFSETRLSGGIQKTMTRNAIDRFSSKTKNHALYTEATYYGDSAGDEKGGVGELCIRITDVDWSNDADRRVLSALCAAILDLNHGFLAIGGLTAIGRGLFAVTGISVNGEDLGIACCENGGLIHAIVPEHS